MTNNNSLDLDVVAKKFAEAEESLIKVKSHLDSISELKQLEENNSKSLVDAANQVSDFVKSASTAIEELNSAQQKVAEILKSASDILDGTDLKEIIDSLGNVSKKVDLIEKNAVSDTDVRNLASKIDSLSTTFTSFQFTSTNSFNEIISKIEKMQKDMTEIHRDVKRPTIVKRLF